LKKIGNIIFWLVICVLLFFLLYTIYMQFRPNDIRRIPGYETPNQSEDGGNKNANNGEDSIGETDDGTDESSGEGTEQDGNNAENDSERIPAPDFTLENLQGEEVSLSDFSGKITIVNFWSLSCPYCIAEMPDLDSAYEELMKGETARIITVNIGDSKEAVEKYIDENKFNLPVLLDTKGEVSRTYGVNSIPITFFVDKDGSAYGYIAGQTDKDTILRIIDGMENRAKE